MLLASITSKKSNILQADEAIEETPEWDKRLQNLVDLFSETLGISCFLMLRCDRERNRNIFYPPKTTIEPDKLLNLCYEIVEDYQSLLRQGQLLNFAESDRLLPLFFLQAAQTYKIRSLLLVPLIYQQSYLGEIFLYSCDRDRQWTEKELKLVRSLVDRCAIEIVQSQLDEQIQQQKLQQELLGKINQKLNCELSPKEILADILDLIGQSFQVDRVMIFNLAQQTNQIEQEWCSNERIIPLSTLSLSLWKESKILTFKNKNKASQFDFHFNELTGSFLHVPIFIRGQFFGSLTLQTQLERRAFTSEEIDTLEYVVQQIAIALYNLQTQETLKQLEDCNKDLEAQKQQSETANRAKSQFLSHMNHELRTPLTGILGFARMLKDEIYGSLNPKQQQYVGAIAASGEHLLSLVNDFLDISKIEADREELFLETVAVEDLCLASLSIVESRAREQSLDLQLEIAPDVDLCKADQRRIKQVLVNLLSNAIKFTEVGSVTLKVQRDGDRLEFSVIDTGIGLKKADQEKLFQPFQQIHNHLSRKHKGTGLGLALSRKLAQLHGGDLTLVSQEGKGSCFTLHLPV